jgi:hypothetical protein
MICWLAFLLRLVVVGLKTRRNLLLEYLALRHQLPSCAGAPTGRG